MQLKVYASVVSFKRGDFLPPGTNLNEIPLPVWAGIGMDEETLQSIVEATEIIAEIQRRADRSKRDRYIPYLKQERFTASKAKIKTLWGGNRVGKTTTAGYEVQAHLTGDYPPWWRGKVFQGPVKFWTVGNSTEQIREGMQNILMGRPGSWGSGLIPGDAITRITKRQGTPDAIDSVSVRHISGGTSVLSFKSEDQGRDSFASAELDGAWVDEEVARAIIDEILMRLMTTAGQLMMTFTPLDGMTELVLWLLEQTNENLVSREFIGWDDAPHLTQAEKDLMVEMYKGNPSQLKARQTGMPTVGRGLIYPFEESSWLIDPFPLETWWPRICGMDVGFTHPTTAVALALDPESRCVYVYNEYCVPQQPTSVHGSALRGWGDVDFAIDPHSNDSSKADGSRMFEKYTKPVSEGGEGLSCFFAQNSVWEGIGEVKKRLMERKLFIFSTCAQLRKEMKLYRFNEKSMNNEVIKRFDDTLDSLRYAVMALPKARMIGQHNRWDDLKSAPPPAEPYVPFDPIVGV